MRVLLMVVFLGLAACKFLLALSPGNGELMARLATAALYSVMFASPQLARAFRLRKAPAALRQYVPAVVAAIGFVATAVYFGQFPGLRPPAWGGEAHFEVPFAFAAEWAIAIVTLIGFSLRGRA